MSDCAVAGDVVDDDVVAMEFTSSAMSVLVPDRARLRISFSRVVLRAGVWESSPKLCTNSRFWREIATYCSRQMNCAGRTLTPRLRRGGSAIMEVYPGVVVLLFVVVVVVLEDDVLLLLVVLVSFVLLVSELMSWSAG